MQEVFLIVYFYCYAYSQAFQDQLMQAVFTMLYFMGLGVSFCGFLFDLVNEHKKVIIPRVAWA